MALSSRNQGIPRKLFRQTATVYGASDDYQAAVKSDLKVRLGHLSTSGAPTGAARSELSALRRLAWYEDYAMPEGARVEIDGVRWNTIRGSFAAEDGAIDANVVRVCDVRPL